MKIQTWVDIFIAITLSISLVIGIVNHSQNDELASMVQRNNIASALLKLVNIRFNLLQNYTNTGKSEYLEQLITRNKEADTIIGSYESTGKEETFIIDHLIIENNSFKQASTDLLALESNRTARPDSSSSVSSLKTHLLSNLYNTGLSISVNSYLLANLNQQHTKIIIGKSSFYTKLSIGLLILLSIAFYILIVTKILLPIRRANKSMRIVASGDLSHVVTSYTNDEIGMLVSSFNHMTSQLQLKMLELQSTIHLLEKSNNDLKQFAYIASHDLQEPLRMISSYLQLIELRNKGKIDKESDEFIEFAVNGAKRLQNLINDLLIYSLFEKLQTTPVPVNFNQALQHTLDNLLVMINENNAVVTHEPLPTIITHESHIIALFQNLISNAIKFRTKDIPRIHVSAIYLNNEWVFSVRDNGIGIDPRHKENLFIAFKRLVGNELPGTGIGLATCRKIIDLYHGRIWVESELGKGSTFYFTIPDA